MIISDSTIKTFRLTKKGQAPIKRHFRAAVLTEAQKLQIFQDVSEKLEKSSAVSWEVSWQ